MKRILLVFPVMFILLAACAANVPVQPQSTPIPSTTEIFIGPTDLPTAAPTGEIPGMKLPAPSFESQTYVDGKAGFALDYPADWAVKEMVVGDRGSQVQFLSSPDLAEAATIPEGETRVIAAIYQWDPKNDLGAYVAHWESIWSDPGFKILDKEKLVLEQGLPAAQFTVQSSDGTITVFLVTALGDRYLVLSGEGNLELAKEIVRRLRPISVK
jgi:hypothetical protein